ncbi:hypothetical protein K435DRAFT_61176 [Dendrothele bispora CBS 962.96]|uniref:Uncharacterized protein n=1 Tax=Dendrothele bispora (strain CBS 962.96) TaxID=1314807 RepID=A0A4S8KRG5_DENBC|nr:hypothetical protein K435DRAFT_61176 [Dendrothele bispora CBS 962.96]
MAPVRRLDEKHIVRSHRILKFLHSQLLVIISVAEFAVQLPLLLQSSSINHDLESSLSAALTECGSVVTNTVVLDIQKRLDQTNGEIVTLLYSQFAVLLIILVKTSPKGSSPPFFVICSFIVIQIIWSAVRIAETMSLQKEWGCSSSPDQGRMAMEIASLVILVVFLAIIIIFFWRLPKLISAARNLMRHRTLMFVKASENFLHISTFLWTGYTLLFGTGVLSTMSISMIFIIFALSVSWFRMGWLAIHQRSGVDPLLFIFLGVTIVLFLSVSRPKLQESSSWPFFLATWTLSLLLAILTHVITILAIWYTRKTQGHVELLDELEESPSLPFSSSHRPDIISRPVPPQDTMPIPRSPSPPVVPQSTRPLANITRSIVVANSSSSNITRSLVVANPGPSNITRSLVVANPSPSNSSVDLPSLPPCAVPPPAVPESSPQNPVVEIENVPSSPPPTTDRSTRPVTFTQRANGLAQTSVMRRPSGRREQVDSLPESSLPDPPERPTSNSPGLVPGENTARTVSPLSFYSIPVPPPPPLVIPSSPPLPRPNLTISASQVQTSTSSRFDSVPLPPLPSLPVQSTQTVSTNENTPPSSFPPSFRRPRSDVPVSPNQRDTIASDYTIETLPSYRSRSTTPVTTEAPTLPPMPPFPPLPQYPALPSGPAQFLARRATASSVRTYATLPSYRSPTVGRSEAGSDTGSEIGDSSVDGDTRAGEERMPIGNGRRSSQRSIMSVPRSVRTRR